MTNHRADRPHFLNRILSDQPRYIGVYAPGEFGRNTYRLVLPNFFSLHRGRGLNRVREDVVLEVCTRSSVDEVLLTVEYLVGRPNGPLTFRHIVNADDKDEGVRLIWARDGVVGEIEMADWPRRDGFIWDGKIVQGIVARGSKSHLQEVATPPSRYLKVNVDDSPLKTTEESAVHQDGLGGLDSPFVEGWRWSFLETPWKGDSIVCESGDFISKKVGSEMFKFEIEELLPAE